MAESVDAFDEIQTIRIRLDAIEQTQEMLVRANAAEVLADVDSLVDQDPLAARTYLLVDGAQTQQDIGSALGTSQQTVSRKLDKLLELHLIRVIDNRGGGNVYAKAAADRILRLSSRIQRRLPK